MPHSTSNDANASDIFYEQALQLALNKTEKEYGVLHLEFITNTEGKERQRAMIQNKLGLDIMWSSWSQQRETRLLPIKFNLLGKLSDLKILMIRCEDQKKFSAVKSIADLRMLTAGTGQHWQDTKILAENDLDYVTSWNYEPMFKMLVAKRFDYMIRGLQEINNELERHKNLPLCAEETLLIQYSLPVYFFVNQHNVELAKRVKKGLEIADKDGSLRKLFLNVPSFGEGEKELTRKPRRLIVLKRSDTDTKSATDVKDD